MVLNNVRMGSQGCLALVKQIKNQQIKLIDLSNNSLGDLGVLPILQGAVRVIPSLRVLNLSANNIGSDGANNIATVLTANQTLWSLELGSAPNASRKNHIESKAAAALAQSLMKNKALSHLGLRGNPIGKGASTTIAADSLGALLAKSKTLTSLSVEETSLGGRGCNVILQALNQNKHFRHLNLGGNNAGPDTGAFVAEILGTNSSICSLRLQNNSIGEGVLDFHTALASNRSLVILDLEANGIGDQGCEAVASVLARNRTLTNLNLASNNISETGARTLAFAIQSNPVLSSLNLNGNPIKNSAAVAFAEALVNNNALLTLDLCSCKIGDQGAIALVSAIGNNEGIVMRRLMLRDNFISGQAGEVIVDALYRNQTLTVADFRGNQVDHVRLSKIRFICKRNLAEIKVPCDCLSHSLSL